MISVCIIAKNEQQNIERCLLSLKKTGFEIVVLDTGSTDDTKQIAQKYTDKVYDFEWCDDFAKAKNYAISKSSYDYVMIIDSDEFLEKIDVEVLKSLIKEKPNEVGRIKRRNIFTRKGIVNENLEWINRIFLKTRYHYEGSIHEQIVSIEEERYKTYQAPVIIKHTGYDLSEEQRKKKSKRNIDLLSKELSILENQKNYKEKSNSQVPYILYQLGKSYYMAEEYDKAVIFFREALCYDLDPNLEYVINMVHTYGYALINSGQAEEALLFENIYREFGNTADFEFLMGLIYMNNARFEDAIEHFFLATAYKECSVVGVNSYSAYYNIGVIYECLGYVSEAKEYYLLCGEYEPAKRQIRNLKIDSGEKGDNI